MAEYIKQPNGKYCKIHLGSIDAINLTEEEIVKEAVAQAETTAKEAIRNAKHSGEIVAMLEKNTINPTSSSSKDGLLKQVGFTDTFNELVKYVPRKPLNKRYIPINFETVGKCPNCGKNVYDGIAFKDEKCDCGQLLNWNEYGL